MKAVILAGGLGTRIAEESHIRPKPMIEIGGKPILWHIMKIYSTHGINDFIVCCGYKGYIIKEYFANYFLHMSDVTFDLSSNSVVVLNMRSEPWRVTLVDTGDLTMTGGRLRAVKNYLEGEDVFCFTYGDGVADIDLSREIEFHRSHGKLATICAVQPPGRYGALLLDGTAVKGFSEKPPGDGSWINGGFFVLQSEVLEFIDNDQSIWEGVPLEEISKLGQLEAFAHKGFWQPMDTLRDKNYLEQLWSSGQAPWKCWD